VTNQLYGITLRAIIDLRAEPQATPDLTLKVQPGGYQLKGQFNIYGGGTSPVFVPPVSGLNRYDLLSLSAAGVLQITVGTGGLYTVSFPATPVDSVPLAYVSMYVGQTEIVETDIIEARTVSQGGTPGAFAGFANPTAQVSGSVVNGSALTAMRSDAAPKLADTLVVSLTGQVADIAPTNIPGASVAGIYLINYYLEDTTADITAGSITLTISWTDDAGATTATATLVLTALGRTPGNIFVRLASGNITYAISHIGIFGSSAYALYVTCQKTS
jgi:hypothetical protein